MAMELRVSAGVHFRLPTDPTSIKAVACPGLCNYTCISVLSISFAGLLGENNRLSCSLQEDEPPGAGAVGLLLNDGMRAPYIQSPSWALTLGPAFYLACEGSAGSGKRECNSLKCVMSRRLHVVPIFWMHKTREKQASCRLQPFGSAKIRLIIGILICC